MSAGAHKVGGTKVQSGAQEVKFRDMVRWLEQNHMVRTSHDYEVNWNGNGWEEMHCEDCRFCHWQRIKEEILVG